MERAHLVNQRRHDHLPYIIPQLGLKLQTPLRVKQQILRQPRPVVPKALIEPVLPHRRKPRPRPLKQIIKVRLVPPVVKLAPALNQPIRILVAPVLQDEPGFEQHAPHVRVHLLEPRAQLGVVVRVFDELLEGVEDDRHGLAVGEALEEGADLGEGGLEGGVCVEVAVRVAGRASDGLGVAAVFFDETEEPLDGLLVVFVRLAFEDDLDGWASAKTKQPRERRKTHLFATEDELVATVFGEVLVEEEALAAVVLITSAILVFLRDAVEESILSRKVSNTSSIFVH